MASAQKMMSPHKASPHKASPHKVSPHTTMSPHSTPHTTMSPHETPPYGPYPMTPPTKMTPPRPIPRPESALERGVQITEFETFSSNPDPAIDFEEAEVLLEEYLSPRRLQQITGKDDLSTVTQLCMKVDTTETSLGNFGNVLPNLTELRLDDSTIPSLRDLGSSLHHLHTLWMPRCCLEELDGISSMANLVELFLSYNLVTDLSPLGMCDNLEVLDVEGNNIDDISQVLFLSTCFRLTRLTLEGNPVCVMPNPDSTQLDYDYRDTVHSHLPELLYLDDEPIFGTPVSACSKSDQQFESLESDWAYLDELKNDALLENALSIIDDGIEEDLPLPSHGRPGSASLRPRTSIRPMTSRNIITPRPTTREFTTAMQSWTAGRPLTSSSGGFNEDSDPQLDSSSGLTSGTVVCGNPGKALLARRKNNPTPTEAEDIPRSHSLAIGFEDLDDKDLMAELSAWRKHHQVMLEKISADKAPRVLKITPGELASDTDDESDFDLDIHPKLTQKKHDREPAKTLPSNKDAEHAKPPRSRKHRVQSSKHTPKPTSQKREPLSQKREKPHKATPKLKLDESFEIEPTSPDRVDQICSPDSGFSSAISPIGSGSDIHHSVSGVRYHTTQPLNSPVQENSSITKPNADVL